MPDVTEVTVEVSNLVDVHAETLVELPVVQMQRVESVARDLVVVSDQVVHVVDTLTAPGPEGPRGLQGPTGPEGPEGPRGRGVHVGPAAPTDLAAPYLWLRTGLGADGSGVALLVEDGT